MNSMGSTMFSIAVFVVVNTEQLYWHILGVKDDPCSTTFVIALSHCNDRILQCEQDFVSPWEASFKFRCYSARYCWFNYTK